ncbi:hypothetical protein XA68_15183 [Ophiocordyceps unilateralis]|uniref:Uncharacterized protein n=1 Tax=Ophiocordyceps unilateralis TaxID=268505 RepID=A0A2A9PMI9_OPHUN|nr:hypothetical protein XA68_15183 [Ophiocordyceps unilateralis]
MDNLSQARHFTALGAYPASRWSTGSGQRRRPKCPPPASVEDEADSLARELGTPSPSRLSEEEPLSRGELDQHPIMLEVHEYNPERRFVLLNDASADVTQPRTTASKTTRVDDGETSKADTGRRYEPASQRPQRTEAERPSTTSDVAQSRTAAPKATRVDDDESQKADARRRHQSASQRSQRTEPDSVDFTRPRVAPKVIDVENPKADGGRRHEPVTQRTEPEPVRPRNRQRLAPLETSEAYQRSPEHRRSRSTAMADAPRPEFFSPRYNRPSGDQLLSPDVITSGTTGRDKSHQAYGQYATSPTRQYHVEEAHRDRADLRHRRTRTSSMSRPFDPGTFSGQPFKRLSGDWAAETGRHKEYAPSFRGSARDHSRSARHSEGERIEPTSPHSSRAHSRSTSRPAKEYTYTYTNKAPLVFQDDHQDSASAETNDGYAGTARSRLSINTAAHPSSHRGETHSVSPTTLRGSSTFPLANGPRRRQEAAQLPYPDDDEPLHLGVGFGKREAHPGGKTVMPSPMIVMPEHTQTWPTAEQPAGTKRPASPGVSPILEAWHPPPLDAENPQTDTDRPAGTYRRYSEGREEDGSGGLPECPRTEPVTGMVDWLTLTRTDFNICPTCYGAVFAQSEFRSHFLPILRPSDEPIACDFGSSPWYRIAWLLTLKHGMPDLQLFYHVAKVAASSRTGPCPGNRKAIRSWLSVNDPYTKRPVPEFAACHQCAMTVEVLLPNLTGLFVPSNHSQPSWEVCALHFTPKRKQFVQYFDAFETTSDRAFLTKKKPDVSGLARELRLLSVDRACREDSLVQNGYWHMMQSVPEFTVCDACFDQVVRPRLEEGNGIARNFFTQPQRLAAATCQLYSARMREVFHKACRRRDREYLEVKVLERRAVEKDICERLLKLDKAPWNDAWSKEQMELLLEDWRRWE